MDAFNLICLALLIVMLFTIHFRAHRKPLCPQCHQRPSKQRNGLCRECRQDVLVKLKTEVLRKINETVGK